MADVERLVKEGVDKVAKGLTQQLETSKRGLQTNNDRHSFIQTYMKDIPTAYLHDLPETSDVNVLRKSEQDIRTRYQADMKTAGVKLPDRGGAPKSNLGQQSFGGSAFDNVMEGLRDRRLVNDRQAQQ